MNNNVKIWYFQWSYWGHDSQVENRCLLVGLPKFTRKLFEILLAITSLHLSINRGGRLFWQSWVFLMSMYNGPPFHIFSSSISFIIVSEFSLYRSYAYFIRLTNDKNSLFEDWEESSVGKVMTWAWGPESDLPRSTLESQALSTF